MTERSLTVASVDHLESRIVTEPEKPCPAGAAAFVVLAGGSGTRVGAGENKVYLPLGGRPVVSWALSWADAVPEVGRVVLVIRPQDEARAQEAVSAAGIRLPVEIIHGGVTRHGSEQNALDHLSWPICAGSLQVVAIHDGARPLAGPGLLRTVIQAAAAHGGAVPTLPENEAWAMDEAGRLNPPPPGETLHRVQTPQAFRATPLLEAYAQALRDGTEGTDTSAALEGRNGVRVVAVAGSPENLKVTFAEDMTRAEALLPHLPSS
nr:2-C-methyl-D-erythritol 4-phosphate cytidylyltransferase [Kineosporia mesophila]